MKFAQVTLQYQEQEIQINLPQDISELTMIINKEFQIQSFEIEVPLDDQQTIFFLMNETHKNEYAQLLKQQKINRFKLKVIKIQQESRQTIFYDTFIKGQIITCCNRLNCPLCYGKGYASIRDEDKYLIDKIIKNNLEKKFEKLKQKLLQNNNLNVESIMDFLKYYQMISQKTNQNLLEQTQSISHQQSSTQTKFQLQISKEFKMKLLFDKEVSQNLDQNNNIIIHYQNNGFNDWPDEVYFLALSGPVKIKQKVQSLKQKEVQYQKINIPVNLLNKGQYIIYSILGYPVSQNMGMIYFGEIIQIYLNVISNNEAIQVVISGLNKGKNSENQDQEAFMCSNMIFQSSF